MPIRPPGLVNPRPDNTSRVKKVESADNRQLTTRADLPEDEDRVTFSVVFDSNAQIGSGFANVLPPLEPGESQPLFVAEEGTVMPYTPDPGLNLITEQTTVSSNVTARLRSSVNGNVQSAPFISAGGFTRDQISGLAELIEGVNALDGTNTFAWEIENVDPQIPLEGAFTIRAITRDLTANE